MNAPGVTRQQPAKRRTAGARRSCVQALGVLAGGLLFAAMYRADVSILTCGLAASGIVVLAGWIGHRIDHADHRAARSGLIMLDVIGLLGSIDLAAIAERWVALHVPASSPARAATVAGAWATVWLLVRTAGWLVDRRADPTSPDLSP